MSLSNSFLNRPYRSILGAFTQALCAFANAIASRVKA
jgi:hypothetical protein